MTVSITVPAPAGADNTGAIFLIAYTASILLGVAVVLAMRWLWK